MAKNSSRGWKILAAIAVLPALQACTVSQERAIAEARAKSAYEHLVGKSIAEASITLGPPATSFPIGQGRQAFQWVRAGVNPGAIIPVGGMLIAAPPTQTECRVTLTASTAAKSPGLPDWEADSLNIAGMC